MRAAAILVLIFTYGYALPATVLAAGFASEGPGLSGEAWDKNRRLDAWLIAPVPEAVLTGLLTIDAAFAEETLRPADRAEHTRQVLKTGLIWHPHHKEGAPRYYIAAARTGLADDTKTVRPLASYTIGSNIIDDDLPFRLAFTATDITMTQLYATWHRFPGYSRTTGGLGHRIRMKNGLIIDLRIPDRALIGFAPADDGWRIFAGWEREKEFFPFFAADNRGWNEECVEKKHVGGRLRLSGPLFLVLSAGERRLETESYSYSGEKVAEQRTTPSPFLRLALESWISVL